MSPASQVADQQKILDLIAAHDTFVLTTHVNPDGDAIGSELAMRQLILDSGKAVRIVNADPIPELLRFLDEEGVVETYDPSTHDELISSVDVALALDNSDLARLGSVRAAIEASPARKACVDHHPNPDPYWQTLLLDESASCTGEIVFRLLGQAGFAPSPATVTALYTALVSDTGRFRFGNTDTDAFSMAAALSAAGADVAGIYSRLEERLGASFLPMCGEVMGSAEIHEDGALIVLRVSRRLLDEYGTQYEDLTEVINFVLRVGSSRVAAMFRENDPGSTKVSLRSKGEIDVNALARRHGGGGHRNASGIVLPIGLDDAIERLTPELVAMVQGRGDA